MPDDEFLLDDFVLLRYDMYRREENLIQRATFDRARAKIWIFLTFAAVAAVAGRASQNRLIRR